MYLCLLYHAIGLLSTLRKRQVLRRVNHKYRKKRLKPKKPALCGLLRFLGGNSYEFVVFISTNRPMQHY